MDPISNVDSLVLLLRQRLAERSRASRGTAEPKSAATERTGPPVDGVYALAGLESVDDRQLKRALVQNLLVDHFGTSLINDAKFQQMVDRVTETIDGEPGSSHLLSRVVGELRASAR